MSSSHFLYLLSIALIGLPVLLTIWLKNERVLKKHEMVLLILIIIGFAYGSTEYFAIRWNAWHYFPNHVLGLLFGAQIETYLVGVVGVAIISSTTLVLITAQDRDIRLRHLLLKRRANARHKAKTKKRHAKSRRVYARTAKATR